MFCICLRTNSDLCHLDHKLTGFYNRDEKCLLRGTNWVFKQSSLRFVFKRLRCLSVFVRQWCFFLVKCSVRFTGRGFVSEYRNTVHFSWFQTSAVFWMLYSFFQVIPRSLNCMCRRFGTRCPSSWAVSYTASYTTSIWKSIPKRRHTEFRRREITQMKEYSIVHFCFLLRRLEKESFPKVPLWMPKYWQPGTYLYHLILIFMVRVCLEYDFPRWIRN